MTNRSFARLFVSLHFFWRARRWHENMPEKRLTTKESKKHDANFWMSTWSEKISARTAHAELQRGGFGAVVGGRVRVSMRVHGSGGKWYMVAFRKKCIVLPLPRSLSFSLYVICRIPSLIRYPEKPCSCWLTHTRAHNIVLLCDCVQIHVRYTLAPLLGANAIK